MYKVIIRRGDQHEEMSFTHDEIAHCMVDILCVTARVENIDEVLLTTSGYDIIESVILKGEKQ